MPTLEAILIESSKVLAAIAMTILYQQAELKTETATLTTIASATASSAGTILGFLITAIALLASVMDRNLIRNLRSTGGYQVLIRGSFTCGAVHLALLTQSIVFLLPWENHKSILFSAIIFTGSLCVIYLATTGLNFYRVIMAMSRSN